VVLAVFHGTYGTHSAVFDWFTLGDTTWRVGVTLDGLTTAMLVVVTTVSFLVHLFSRGYMHGDENYTAFFRWLGFFTFSMLGLVLSDNLITLFVMWELMGLASYKLIGHYFFKPSAYMACKKAFMVTRVGDVGMFLALLAVYMHTGTLRFTEIFAQLDLIPEATRTWIALGLFMGAAGKSAQFPLHVWLPDAMEGPTPVSALIHAATMVAAGVYLIGRMYALVALSPVALVVISLVGCFTALFAASIAFTQTDIKKVLAYSTVSQLGFMFTALGVGTNLAWQAGLFHLVTHACFKGCLFLCSGSVIHACHHEQDMTKMGGLWRKLPVTHATYLVSCLSIAGFPLFAGFFSKDQILQGLWLGGEAYAQVYRVVFVVLALTAGMTAFYMFRSYFLTFWTKPRDHHVHDHAHESPAVMTVPLVVLAVLAVAAGYGWKDSLLPAGADSPLAAFTRVWASDAPEVHAAHNVALGVSLVVALSGIALAFLSYQTAAGARARVRVRQAVQPLYDAAQHKFYVDELVNVVVVKWTVFTAALSAWFDSAVLDGIVDGSGRATVRAGDASALADDHVVDGAVQAAASAAWGGGGALSRAQTGRVRNYLFGGLATLGLFAVLVLYLSRS
jgi:NADH-quinone oxidoreductase subunit L